MGKDPERRKCRGDIFPAKMIEYNIKGLCTSYIQQGLYKVVFMSGTKNTLCLRYFMSNVLGGTL